MKLHLAECPVCLKEIEYGGSPAGAPFALAAHRLEGDCEAVQDGQGRLLFGSNEQLKAYDARMKELMDAWHEPYRN